jgi:AraC-like DNA-binding protein
MESVEIVMRFLTNLLKVPVQIADTESSFLTLFEEKYCFMPDIQPNFTAISLRRQLLRLKKRVLAEIHDPLGIRLILFIFGDTTIVVGPFVENEWNDLRAVSLLAKLKIPANWLTPYKLYYCSHRILTELYAASAIQAATDTFYAAGNRYTHRVVTNEEYTEELQYNEIDTDDTKIETIKERYDIENELLRNVKNGKVYEALKSHEMIQTPSYRENYTLDDITAAKSAISSIRTLLRKTSESAGVHVAIVDSIALKYKQQTDAINTSSEMKELVSNMIVEFTTAVNSVLSEDFPPLVRKAADYININFSRHISIDDIAKHICASPNHLCRIFKEASGVTISQYIAAKRCKEAAELLRYADLSVSDIAAHVGYSDSNYFVKVFKSQYGVVPSKY